MTTRQAPDTSSPARHPYVVPGFIALSAIWGSSFLFIKVGIGELHPVYVTLTRVALGAVTTLLLMVILRDRLPRGVRVWAHLVVVGVIGVALPFTLFGYGEQRIPSLLAGIWNATTPLVALPLAALVFRTERFTLRKLAGVVLGFTGVLVVLGVWQGVGGAVLAGQVMCSGAACCYGVAIPYLRRFVTSQQSSGLALVAGQMVAATAVMVVVAPLAAGAPPVPTRLSPEVIGSMVALGAIGTGFAFLIHYRNIRLVGASAASLVTYLVPLFAVLVGVIVLDESLTWYQPVGTLVVFSGIAIMQGSWARPLDRGLRWRYARWRPGIPLPRRRRVPLPEPAIGSPAPAHAPGTGGT